MYQINDLISSTGPLAYSKILDIDRKLRELQIPLHLRIPPCGSSWDDDGPLLVLQRFMIKNIFAVG